MFLNIFYWDIFLDHNQSLWRKIIVNKEGSRVSFIYPKNTSVFEFQKRIEDLEKILFTKIIYTSSFQVDLYHKGLEDELAYLSQHNIKLSHLIRTFLIEYKRILFQKKFFHANELLKLEENVLNRFNLDQDRKIICSLIREVFGHRRYFEEHNLAETKVWNVAALALEIEELGYLRKRVNLPNKALLDITGLGLLEIIKLLGNGYEHSVYLTKDRLGRKFVLKIAHFPHRDLNKKKEYKEITSAKLPIVKWKTHLKGHYTVERIEKTGIDIVESWILHGKNEKELMKMIDFYSSYLNQNLIVKDLTFENIGLTEDQTWKIIDWYGVNFKNNISDEIKKKLQKLELSIKLSISLELFVEQLNNKGQSLNKIEIKRFKVMLKNFIKKLELDDVQNQDDYLHSGFRSIIDSQLIGDTLVEFFKKL